MKIGIISDIHAQYDSLEKALHTLEREKVDTIICAGDLVGRGTEGERVVRKIQELDISCVLGNHDEWASEMQQDLRVIFDADTVQETLSNFEKGIYAKSMLLSEQSIEFVSNLPFQLTFNWEDTRVLLVHGSPKSNMDYLMSRTSEERFAYYLEGITEDIMISGHTHQPLCRQANGILVLNPGSVFRKTASFSRTSYTCAVLELPSRDFQVFSLKTGTTIE